MFASLRSSFFALLVLLSVGIACADEPGAVTWTGLAPDIPGLEWDQGTAVAVSGSTVYLAGYVHMGDWNLSTRIYKFAGGTWSLLGVVTQPSGKGYVNTMIVSGGDLYVGGYFTAIGGVAANNIAKWNGSTWQALGSGVQGTSYSTVQALAVDGNDLYVGGFFAMAGGIPAGHLAKWNGQRWSSLNVSIDGGVTALAVLGNRLYASGGFYFGGSQPTGVAEYDGTSWKAVGSDFRYAVRSLLAKDGQLYAAGQNVMGNNEDPPVVTRWDGTAWSIIGTLESLRDVVLAASGGDLYLAGAFGSVNGLEAGRLARWDGTFWSAVGHVDAEVNDMVTDSFDHLYLCGEYFPNGDATEYPLARANLGHEATHLAVVEQPLGTALQDDVAVVDFGTVDTSSESTRDFRLFNAWSAATFQGVQVSIVGDQAADFILTTAPAATVAPGGSTGFSVRFAPSASGVRQTMLRITSPEFNGNAYDIALRGTAITPLPGSVDALDVAINDEVVTTAIQPDGKIIIGGRFTTVKGVPRRNLARLNANGTVDMGFDPSPDYVVIGLLVQADGRILVRGWFETFQPQGALTATPRSYLARLNADGSLDAAFAPNPNDPPSCLAVQPDGKVLIGGGFTALQPNGTSAAVARKDLVRLNADGTLDSGFNLQRNYSVYCMALQPNGKILVGGFGEVAKLNADGSPDNAFAPRPNGSVFCLAVQPDGKVLLGGNFGELEPQGTDHPVQRFCMARVNADGSLDNGFDPFVYHLYGLYRVSGLAVQADGKVILAGDFSLLRPNGAATATTRNRVARVNADGSLDASFDPNVGGGSGPYVDTVALQADGKVLIGGLFETLQPPDTLASVNRHAFARLRNDSATTFLTVPDATQASWARGGTAPELSFVMAELSTDDGAHWTPLGQAARLGASANWSIGGLSLPLSGQVRFRGRTVDHRSLVEQVTPFAQPIPDLRVFAAASADAAHEVMDAQTTAVDLGYASSAQTVSRPITLKSNGGQSLQELSVTLDGDAASAFEVSALSATTLASGATLTVQVSFHPAATGVRTATLHIASNDPDTAVFDIPLSGMGVTTQEAWRHTHFGTIANDGDAGDEADPDGDGMANLLELLTGSNPKVVERTPINLTNQGGVLTFTFTRSSAAASLPHSYVVWSDSLQEDAWSESGVTTTVLSDDGTKQQVKATVPIGTGRQRFMRLAVSMEPLTFPVMDPGGP